ncbi:metal-dependent transcriptional regulator [Corynebacterium cystitidis]|uniref:metal-dependent transcriptional regulator n=1 Tax=Corynebacterium cystitidis TaxID=35757 RepID=UPI00211EB3BA|nr:metal-dependent transcriptional regulator [Corynebacterium cystitidis]
MHIRDLPERSQDYVKTIWDITEYTGEPAALGEIARRLEQKTPTASEAIKRLGIQGIVHHEPYSGIRLTDTGTQLAIQMVRRHRLVETFLVTVLGYSWDEVHDDADLLEHSVSDTLLERIDAHLGHPTVDPHGDPIPRADGSLIDDNTTSLAHVKAGTYRIAQVDDEDPELLRYLDSHGLVPGEVIVVKHPVSVGLLTVNTEAGEEVTLAESSLGAIRVRR